VLGLMYEDQARSIPPPRTQAHVNREADALLTDVTKDHRRSYGNRA